MEVLLESTNHFLGVVDLGIVLVRTLRIYCQSTKPKIMQRQTTGDALRTEVCDPVG